jgi:hypothetical protein
MGQDALGSDQTVATTRLLNFFFLFFLFSFSFFCVFNLLSQEVKHSLDKAKLGNVSPFVLPELRIGMKFIAKAAKQKKEKKKKEKRKKKTSRC